MKSVIRHHGVSREVEPGDYRIKAYHYGSGRENEYRIILHPGQTHAILGMDPNVQREWIRR